MASTVSESGASLDLLEIARQLGHSRPQISRVYVGSPALPSPSVSPSETKKEAQA
jgi:hypothetical protein